MTEQISLPVDPAVSPVIIEPSPDHARLSVPLWMITLGMLIVMAISFWGSIGLHTTGLVEDWAIYSSFDTLGPTLTISTNPPQPDRPFLTAAYAIGYILTPNSFVGLEIVGILIFIGNGLAIFSIVRQLMPDKSVIAFIIATLFVIFPADSGVFNTRYYSYNLTVLCFLVAVTLFIRYWRRPHWAVLIGMYAALLLCLGTYETGYPLIFVTPLILIWQQKGISRRVVRIACLWYVIPFIMLVWTFGTLAATASTNYQFHLLNGNTDPPATRFTNYIVYELHAYAQALWGGWADTIHRLNLHAYTYFTAASILVVPIALLGFGIVWVLMRQNRITMLSSPPSPTKSSSRIRQVLRSHDASLVMFVIGLASIGLGFVMYLPIPSHRVFTDRVYLFPSIGAAICVGILLYEIASIARRWAAPGLAVLFVFIFGLAGFGAMGRAVGLRYDSSQEQAALAQVAQQMPKVPDYTSIVIFDDTHTLTSNMWRFGTVWNIPGFQDALTYLYREIHLRVYYCYPEPTSNLLNGVCSLNSDGIHFNQTVITGADKTISYDKFVALSYQPDTGYKLLSTLPVAYRTAQNATGFNKYNPYSIIDIQAAPPSRVHTLFETWPFTPFVPHPILPQQSIALDLDDVNMAPGGEDFQNPVLADGWTAGPWMLATTASIHTLLAPGNDYYVSFSAKGDLLPEIINSLTFSVNDQPIVLSRTNDGSGSAVFAGVIPQSVVGINPTDTFLRFHIDKVISGKLLGINDNPQAIGVRIDWLHIIPFVLTPQQSIALTSDNLNLPHNGEGSQYPQFSTGWNGGWTTAPTASFYALLTSGNDYRLSFHIGKSLSPEIINSLTFSVNNQVIPLIKTGDTNSGFTFSGNIASAVINLDQSHTLLAFHTDNPVSPKSLGLSNDTRMLGVNIDWLNIYANIHQKSLVVNLHDFEKSLTNPNIKSQFVEEGWTNDGWTLATTASLHVLLAQGVDYVVKFHSPVSMSPEILDSLTFSVNGQIIPLTRVNDAAGGATFTGTIPQAAININPTDTLLEFHTDKVVSPKSIGMNEDTRTLGINVAWLHIDPATRNP